MAGFFKKLADRFRPSPIEQIQQSAEAKKKQRERAYDKPHVEQPPKGKLIRPSIDIETTAPTGGWGNQHNDGIWQIWHTNNTTACTTYDDPWSAWHNGNTCTGVTSSNAVTVWRHWVVDTGTTSNRVVISNAWGSWVDEADRTRVRRNESAKERKRREAEEARFRAEEEARIARFREEERASANRRLAADERAMKLLLAMLNDEQRSDVQKNKHFFVNAKSGRLYRIDLGTHGNVKVVDRVTRKIIERLCIQPNGVPAADANLAQKLMIETAEEVFRAHANITLENGEVVRGDPTPLTGEKLALILPFRKAA